MEVVKRGHEDMLLARHWISDGAKKHRRAR
jgi:hypothetical protein